MTAPAHTSALAPAIERITGATTLGRMVLSAAERGDDVALRQVSGAIAGGGPSLTYAQLGALAREIGRGLIALGLERGDVVSILANTRAGWTVCEFGALCAGAAVAPIYHTNSPQECEYVLSHSAARAVFCENAAQVAKVAEVRDRCPHLEHVIVIDGEAEGATTLESLRRSGESVQDAMIDERVQSVEPGDLATIVYTSGTTGPPKGCMLSHANFLSATAMYRGELELDDIQPVIYMFLPLAHVLARIAQTVVIDVGGTLVYWSRDPQKIIDEVTEVGPTHFVAVPRIYEKVHSGVLAAIDRGGPPARLLFAWSLEVGRRARPALRAGRSLGRLGELRLALADRLALGRVRSVFGPNLQMALVGAAPIDRELLEFFDACGVAVIEGYGLTESCATGTLNPPRTPRYGTVGRALPDSEISVTGEGEVLLRGPHVFLGYHRNPAATEEVMSEGWLRSGDLGSISPDGYLAITGRQKDLIITSSGKNVTPVNLENGLRESRWISEAVVYGDRRPYLVAMVTLDTDEAPRLAEQLGTEPDIAGMARDPRVHEAIQADVDATNRRFARIEQIKRFAILDHDLSQAAGELTPTMKVKRAAVYSKYAGFFDDLYDQAA